MVEVDLAKRILLLHKPEEDVAEVIRGGRMDWPFAADLNEVFARLP